MTALTRTGPRIVRTIADVRAAVNEYRAAAGAGATVGLVPTMGYLHEGHASLMRRSASENGLTVLSVFVNPLQFGPNEDFDRYPRDEERDRAVAAEAGADVLFMPSVGEMYPRKPLTSVLVSEVTSRLCGASRPGHFDGVGTVVSKLFNIVGPDRAYFGMKDAQQVAVVTRMAEDLNVPVEIVPCPIVRDPDGLAMSSRNVYLTAEEREQALVLSRTLAQVPGWLADDAGLTSDLLKQRMEQLVRRMPLADIEYAEVLTYPDLLPPGEAPLREAAAKERLLVALAVRFGRTRLIDNILLTP
ncbi:pantoate--beta-alanine ligase [Cohnella zeiphila]|uniref:Pantothenate synthetase n=1 Tax=Cohnella zeiphila TaxID=2761120 RepID=A0A7X0SUN3_9BACL|nr:pantoate--beta-alanine ligase [Cohnella zeiphila]MBB6735464.1 pantoate--beta-alanine ligase [Cohnella zeiphila]